MAFFPPSLTRSYLLCACSNTTTPTFYDCVLLYVILFAPNLASWETLLLGEMSADYTPKTGRKGVIYWFVRKRAWVLHSPHHYTCVHWTPRGPTGLARHICVSKLTSWWSPLPCYDPNRSRLHDLREVGPNKCSRSKGERIYLRWRNMGTSWPRLSTSGMALMHHYPAEQVWLTEMGNQNKKNIAGVWNADYWETTIWCSYLPCRLHDERLCATDARRPSCDGAHFSLHDMSTFRRIHFHLKKMSMISESQIQNLGHKATWREARRGLQEKRFA